MKITVIKKIILYYLPAVIWMGVIFYFSSIPELRSGSGSITIEIILRKGAHIFEYMVLALLLWRIFYETEGLSTKKAQVIVLVIVMVSAISDETHQLFVEGRAGKIVDVVIDFLSGSAAILAVSFFHFQKKNGERAVALALILLSLLLIIFLMVSNRNCF